MASDVEPERTDREESCFSRAARQIRRALSRICRDKSPSNRHRPQSQAVLCCQPLEHQTALVKPRYKSRGSPMCINISSNEYDDDEPFYSSILIGDCRPSFDYGPPPPLLETSPERRHKVGSKRKTSSPSAPPSVPQPDYEPLRVRSRDIDDCLTKSSRSLLVSTSPTWFDRCPPPRSAKSSKRGRKFRFKRKKRFPSAPPPVPQPHYVPLNPVCRSQCPQDRPAVLQDSMITEGSEVQDAFDLLSVPSVGESGGDGEVLVEIEAAVTAVNYSVTNTQPTHPHLLISSSGPGCSTTDSSCLSRSHSVPSLSQTTSAENKTFTRAQSLPDMLLKSSFEEFTPDITVDEDDETYRFQCSCPGLYQCSVTGLVFHMEGEGDVVYRTVPWNRRLLAQRHKQPAGPLFDIKCLQQSVCQLHLPHCEISSTAGGEFLSVAHVDDEGIEFIAPHKVTETHVIINITGFSAFGNVKDEDSPPDLIRALVLLFYSPPADPDPDPESLLNVLLLPRNVVLRDVLRTRKKLFGEEMLIQTSPHCKLHPEQEYTLSTCPEDDSVLVQPTEAEFDCDNYDNYFPSFQVSLEKVMKHIKVFLRDTNKQSVWERRVCLSSSGVKRSCGPSALSLPPNERLLEIRSSFIDGISGPVLKSLLDKLFEKTVMTEPERESADEIQNHRDKARFVIDTVRKKGEAASSEMIEFLSEVDPFLCEHLGLI